MARIQEVAGHAVEQHNSPNKGGRMSDHRGIVLHIAQGSYRGTISWQRNADQRYQDGTRVTTSSTWIVGRDRGEIAQMVDSDRIAWAHRGGSATWLSIELAGFAPNAPTDWQIEACAHLLAWSARQYGHPIARADHEGERGLGHHSMDREQFGVEWGHDQCPGAGVINAKNKIVRRAREIAEGNDMPSAKEVAEAVYDRFTDDRLSEDAWAARAGLLTAGKPLYPIVVGRNSWAHSKRNGKYLREVLANQRALLKLQQGGTLEDAQQMVRDELDRHRDLTLDELVALLGPALTAELQQAAGDLPEEVLARVGDVVERAVESAANRISLTVESADDDHD